MIEETSELEMGSRERHRSAVMGSTENVLPRCLAQVSMTSYDGVSDDLLTAGLGWDGLRSTSPPTVSTSPAAAELRRLAIYFNYRALLDMTDGGGYGRLFGPNVSLSGVVTHTAGAGKIAGTEYLAYCLNESGRPAATMMVQVPAHFDRKAPRIMAVPSPGSRGIYGGIALGEWGLKRGCAVAYTDKGAGNGAHELGADTVLLIDGLMAKGSSAGSASHFTAALSEAQRAAYNATHPFRYAFKHAHSQQSPEKHWGRFVLLSVEFALFVLNELYGPELPGRFTRERRYMPDNTLVIAFSLSNGGGAALAAGEQDEHGLIDAIVVGEPQVALRIPDGLTVRRGNRRVENFGKPLFEYISLANLLQPCAAHAAACAESPLLGLVDQASAQKRGQELADAGPISGDTFTEQANEALERLHQAGWEPETDLLHASYYGLEATTGVAVTYANAYARATVIDNLCGFSFATTTTDQATGAPGPGASRPMTTLFGDGNGIPPTPPIKGIHIVYDNANDGPIDHRGADGDFALRGALCLRDLWSGSSEWASTVRRSIDELSLSGDLHGKPAIIVHGRSDALVPVNHTSRPYFGMNKMIEGEASRLSYIEVENVQHFDTFLGLFQEFAWHWLPLHYYLSQALELMWNHLQSGQPHPPSQVVRTNPRGKESPPLEPGSHLGSISLTPRAGDAVEFDRFGNAVRVPD
jgi:hydroxybutyrate-dimer hydrolase